MPTLFEPNELRDVLAIARSRALGAAARRLAIDASTMGRRLAALEARLGFALFLRSRAGLEPTPNGAKVVRAAEQLEAQQAALERELRAGHAAPTGTVRVSTAEWGALLLAPALAELALAAPQLAITLLVENRVVDLARGEADLALRIGRPTQAALAARRLGFVAYGLYASGDYLARHGVPAHAPELDRHVFCALEGPPPTLPHLRLQARVVRDRRVAVRTNSLVALIEAVRASTGLAVLPTVLAGRAGLRRVLDDVAGAHNALWAVFHEGLGRSAAVRATIEHLAARLALPLRLEPPATARAAVSGRGRSKLERP